MKRIHALFATVLVAALLGSAAQAKEPVESPTTAAAFDAHLTIGSVSTHLGPIAHAFGQNGGAYDSNAQLINENKTVALAPQNPTPSLFVNIPGAKAHVSSAGIQLDSESSEGDTTAKMIAIALNLNPLPPGPHPSPFLQVTADVVKANASLGIVFPSTSTPSGSATIHNLKIFGSALGFAAVHFSGKPAPNTVIYDTPTVTITLNKQTQTGLISCSPGCTFTVSGIETDAVDIDLHKAVWNGKKVSGEIVIGRTIAQ